MDYLWQEHFNYSWMGLLGLILRLGILFFAVHLTHKTALRIGAPTNWQLYLRNGLKYFLLFFEPLVCLALLSYWVLINPFYHGMIAFLLLVISFRHFINYFSGRILLFNHSFKLGNRLKTDKMSGIVTKIERLGLKMQFNKGVHFIAYTDLLKEGFSLLEKKEKGGFFKIKLSTKEDADSINLHQISAVLNEAPFINGNHPPDIQIVENSNPTQWTAYIRLHQEKHLKDILELLKERQFVCQLIKF